MTIGELAEQAGVTPRTIRYYVEQGLLPTPEYGRPAEYTGEHLRRLDLIRRLKDQYLPLDEIRDMVQRLSLEQVEALASGPEPAPPAQQAGAGALSSAAEYIAQVLGRGAAREQLKQGAPGTPPGAPPGTPPWMPATPPMWVPPAAGPPPAPLAPAPAPATPLVPMPPPADAPGAKPAEIAPPESWQRIPLAPGLELHYTAGAAAGRQAVVARLIRAARHILESQPEQEGEEP